MKNRIFNTDLEKKLWKIAIKEPFPSKYFLLPDSGKQLYIREIFPGYKKYNLELGSGWGEFSTSLAVDFPDEMFILMEKNQGRNKQAVRGFTKQLLENIRIIPVNFTWFLTEILCSNSFDSIFLNFPDPWPKKKHWKHRTVNTGFLNQLDELLTENGRFIMATDYGPYARKAIRAFRKDTRFAPTREEFLFKRPEFPASRFEMEKRQENCRIWFMDWMKKN